MTNSSASTEHRTMRYVVLPGKNPPASLSKQYDDAFEMWRAVWTEQMNMLDGAELTMSDGFTRQDCIGAIFSGEQCGALCCFSVCDLRSDAAKSDSWFVSWPKEIIYALSGAGDRYGVVAWFTVAEQFRGTKSDLEPAIS